MWPKNRVDRSIVRMSHSGSALWISLTSQNPVSPDSTSFSAQMRRWSSLRDDVNRFLSAIPLHTPHFCPAMVVSGKEIPKTRDMEYICTDACRGKPEQFVNFPFHSTGYIGM